MLAVELRLVPSGRGDRGARVDAITWLTGANGSLMKDCVVAVDHEGWIVNGVAPARDTFRRQTGT